jgi:hypothetical protein
MLDEANKEDYMALSDVDLSPDRGRGQIWLGEPFQDLARRGSR